MATLPGDSISPSGTQGFIAPQADRPTVGYTGGIAQRAGIGLGEGIGRLGMVGEEAAMTIQDTQDKLAAANAEQNFLSKKLDLDQQFATDKDPATAPQRYRAALQGALAETGQGITGNVQRVDYQNRMSRWVEYGTNSMLRESVAKWKDQGKGNTITALDDAVNNALRAPDEPTRSALFSAAHDRIDGAVDSGWFTATEGAKLRQSVPQAYAQKRATMMADTDPAAAVKALQPTGVGADGTPTFDQTGDWRDYLDPAKRMDVVRAAQAHADSKARADEVDAQRADRIADKERRDRAEVAGNAIVSQLIKDPTQVDPKAIANTPDLTFEQKWHLHEMQKAALTQQADGKDTKTYGSGFWDAYKSVHAPDGDPGKISDPAQLYPRGGPAGDLTVAGIDKLTSEIQAKRTPEGEAESEMKKQFLSMAKGQITGSSEGLGGLRDHHGDELFLKFMATALPAYDAAKKAGKSPSQLLNPDSPDYIGKSIGQFKRPMAQWASDMLGDNAPGAEGALDLTSQDGIVKAYRAGKIDRDAAGAALLKGGFAAAATAPAAPAEPAVPMAR
jgi:hypothetical protein